MMVVRFGKGLAAILLWVMIAVLLAVTFVPAFLDRLYYSGAISGHYDGQHFHNIDPVFSPPVPQGVSMSRGNLATRFIFARSDRTPWPGHVNVKPDHPPQRVEGGAMRATWVGHATVLVQTAGLNILTDPIWSDYASPFPPLGPKRVMEPGISFADLPKIDIVVISHNHYDHMDLPTLKRLWERDRPLIVTGLGNDSILRKAGVQAVALDWGQEVAARGGAKVHVLRNHHWSSRWGQDRNRALWSAFLIETPGGNIFFAGDTGRGDGQWPLAAKAFGPIRLALIPIGAFRFFPGQMENDSHIGPEQAAVMMRQLNAAQAIPIHWGTFRLSNEGWDTPPKMLNIYARCANIASGRFAARAAGEAVMVPTEPAIAMTGEPSPAVLAACQPGSAALAALK